MLVITSLRPTKLALLAMPLPLPQAQVQVPHGHHLVSALFHVLPPRIISEGIRGGEREGKRIVALTAVKATSTSLPFRGGANANAVGATFMVLALLCALTYLL